MLPVGHPLARRRALPLVDLVDAGWLDAPDTAVTGAAGVVGVPVDALRLVHRVELVHGTITGPAATLAARLS